MSDGVNVAKLDNVLRDGYLTLAVGWAVWPASECVNS